MIFGHHLKCTGNEIKNRQMIFHKTKKLQHSKVNANHKAKKACRVGKIFTMYTFDKWLIPRMYKEKLNSRKEKQKKRKKNPSKQQNKTKMNEAEVAIDKSPKKGIRITQKCMKMLKSLIRWKMQPK